jgi:hypothetical protein
VVLGKEAFSCITACPAPLSSTCSLLLYTARVEPVQTQRGASAPLRSVPNGVEEGKKNKNQTQNCGPFYYPRHTCPIESLQWLHTQIVRFLCRLPRFHRYKKRRKKKAPTFFFFISTRFSCGPRGSSFFFFPCCCVLCSALSLFMVL